jgi:hypothetical protein
VLDADLVTVGQGFSVKLCGTLRLRAIFSLFIVPYKASDAVLQNWNIEVDESTDRAAGETKVGQHHGLVDSRYRLNGFQLDNNLARHQEIQAVSAFEFEVSINEGNRFLTLERDVAHGELASEAFFVDRFEEAWTKVAVNLDGGADYRASYCVVSSSHR